MTEISKENLWEEVLHDMYLYMELHIDKEKSYEYHPVHPYEKTYWQFTDRYQTINGTRLLIEKNKFGIKKFGEIKFGEVDEDGSMSFDVPIHYDEKTFNTHIKIILEEILLKHVELDYYRMSPIDEDPRRSRLYGIAITKYLNPDDWEIFTNDKETIKNTIWIRRKSVITA